MYETLEGHLSPSQWARHVRDSDALRWLGQGIRPSRSTLYAFRDRLGDPVFEIHAQAIRAAIAEGLTRGESAALDGTAVRACASRHHLPNEGSLTKRIDALDAAVAADAAAVAADAAAGQPTASRPAWMARTPGGRRGQLGRYRTASAALAGRLADNDRRPKDKRLDRSQVRVSVTDPRAPLGRDKEKVFAPLYTTQFVVDTESLLVLSFDVFAQPTDAGTLPPMLDRTRAVTGVSLRRILTDAGYVSLLDLRECLGRGVQLIGPVQENDFSARKRAQKGGPPRIGKDRFEWLAEEQTYRCPMGHLLDPKSRERRGRREGQEVIQRRYHCAAVHCVGCPLSGDCVRDPKSGRTVKRSEGEELMEAHKAFMETAEAKEAKRQRGAVIERCFGDAKEHRHLRRLHGRGLGRAKAEIGLVVLAQTALTLARLRKEAATPRKDKA